MAGLFPICHFPFEVYCPHSALSEAWLMTEAVLQIQPTLPLVNRALRFPMPFMSILKFMHMQQTSRV